MNAQVLGFVGLGNMGGPMSARLADAGYQIVAFDIAGTEERMPSGAVAADSVEEIARKAHTVFLSLPDGLASIEVCGALANAESRRCQVVVDLSTIGIAAAQECGEILKAVGVTYVDAPVSGGVRGARAGTLTVMVGGEQSVFEMLRPLFAAFSANCFRMGDEPGLGQAMKLLNNFLLATAFAATSEAVVFGTKIGLGIAKMIEVVNASSGRSGSSAAFSGTVVPRTYDSGFAGALMTKDATLYLENAAAAGVPHEIASLIARLWQRFNGDYPGQDFTYIHKYFEDIGLK